MKSPASVSIAVICLQYAQDIVQMLRFIYSVASIHFSTNRHQILKAANIYAIQSSLLYIHIFQRKGCAPQPLPLLEQIFFIPPFITAEKEYTYFTLFCKDMCV